MPEKRASAGAAAKTADAPPNARASDELPGGECAGPPFARAETPGSCSETLVPQPCGGPAGAPGPQPKGGPEDVPAGPPFACENPPQAYPGEGPAGPPFACVGPPGARPSKSPARGPPLCAEPPNSPPGGSSLAEVPAEPPRPKQSPCDMAAGLPALPLTLDALLAPGVHVRVPCGSRAASSAPATWPTWPEGSLSPAPGPGPALPAGATGEPSTPGSPLSAAACAVGAAAATPSPGSGPSPGPRPAPCPGPGLGADPALCSPGPGASPVGRPRGAVGARVAAIALSSCGLNQHICVNARGHAGATKEDASCWVCEARPGTSIEQSERPAASPRLTPNPLCQKDCKQKRAQTSVENRFAQCCALHLSVAYARACAPRGAWRAGAAGWPRTTAAPRAPSPCTGAHGAQASACRPCTCHRATWHVPLEDDMLVCNPASASHVGSAHPNQTTCTAPVARRTRQRWWQD